MHEVQHPIQYKNTCAAWPSSLDTMRCQLESIGRPDVDEAVNDRYIEFV